MWLDWLKTERGRYYVDQLFDIPKTQVIIKQAERFFNNERNPVRQGTIRVKCEFFIIKSNEGHDKESIT